MVRLEPALEGHTNQGAEMMKMPFDPRPVVLSGQTVRLEPLSLSHAADLFEAGQDSSIWTYMPIGGFREISEVRTWIEKASAGGDVAFGIIQLETNRAVGSTRLMDIRREHGALEIGWTWLSPLVQRTGVNTEAKFLLLRHAFEDLGAVRVQLKTDSRNLRSQKAIERIGAVREGVLRRHMRLWNGYLRDTVYFSVLDHEWPQVKDRLLEKLQKNARVDSLETGPGVCGETVRTIEPER